MITIGGISWALGFALFGFCVLSFCDKILEKVRGKKQ